jgi:tetratricopeptide (TPR) repeat protein
MSRLRVSIIVIVVVVLPGSAWPDQTDKRLDALFARLQATEDEAEARRITGRIWVIWRETPNDVARNFMRVGMRAMSEEHYEQALQAFNKVVQAAPEFAEGWNARATLLYLMGDYPASVTDIRRTLALEPRHFGAWSGLGLIYMSLERYQAALEAFDKALKLNPHLTGSRRNIDLIKKRLKDKVI